MKALRESRPLFIVDLDGTLFDNTHRRHLVPTENPRDPHSWSAFNKACVGDTPIVQNITTVRTLIDAGFAPIYVTSRGTNSHNDTANQLRGVGLVPHPLVMRPMDELRPPMEWKAAVLDDIENYYGYKITIAIDDDPKVCQMMRDRGIAVAQVSTRCASLTYRVN